MHGNIRLKSATYIRNACILTHRSIGQTYNDADPYIVGLLLLEERSQVDWLPFAYLLLRYLRNNFDSWTSISLFYCGVFFFQFFLNYITDCLDFSYLAKRLPRLCLVDLYNTNMFVLRTFKETFYWLELSSKSFLFSVKDK